VVPLRGEVWDAHLPVVGSHPVVVLTVNPLLARLRSVTVSVVTGTEGPRVTHVELGRAAGLTKDPVSYANATDVHTVAQTRLTKRRGILHPAEMARLEDAVRTTLGL
jgi:mRNA interferase MazF